MAGMARPYRRLADIVVTETDIDHAYDRIEGFILDWLPGQGPFPMVLDRTREYRIYYDHDRDTWVLCGRTAPRPGDGDDEE